MLTLLKLFERYHTIELTRDELSEFLKQLENEVIDYKINVDYNSAEGYYEIRKAIEREEEA